MTQYTSKRPLHRNIRPTLSMAALALTAAISTAAAQESPSDGVYADRVDWGIQMDMSGPTSSSQSPWVTGFRDYVDMVNEDGGVNGRRINLLVEDNRFDPATDKIAYEKFVSQTPVIAISGLGSSTSQAALAPSVREGKVPVIGTYTPTKALSEPASPMVYNGFCGYRQMAEAGVAYYADKLGLEAPKVMTVAIETAGGKDYAGFVAEAAQKHGGTATSTTMKVSAADVTPQVQQILAEKPDFITIYGIENTTILTMKTMAQYGLDIPAFGITYLGTPSVYKALGPDAGENYTFISCFTPGGADETEGNAQLVAQAEKAGHQDLAANINYVAGWVAGQIAAEALAKAGENPTRASLVDALKGGFTVDTKGLSAPITYTAEDHTGPQALKMFGYDYEKNAFTALSEYPDAAKQAQ